MSEKEKKKLLETIAKAWPKIPDYEKGRIVGTAEAYAKRQQKREAKK